MTGASLILAGLLQFGGSGPQPTLAGLGGQPLDADLTSLAAISGAANDICIYWTAEDTIATFSCTAALRALADDANAAAMRATLDVEAGVDLQAYDADLTSWGTVTPSAFFLTLGDDANVGALHTTLGYSANVQTLLGAANYAAFKTSLSLTVGTDVQAYDADLTTYAGITPSANVQTMLGSADNSAIRTNVGVAIGTNVQAYDADLTTYAGITPSADVQTMLGSADKATIRSNIGVGIGAAVQAYDADLDTLSAGAAADPTFDDLTVDTLAANGRASLYGGVTYNLNPITFASNPYTVAAADVWIFCDPAGGNTTITLPSPGGSPAGYAGATICAKKYTSNANKCVLDTPGAETIDGAASIDLDVDYEFRCVTSTGSNWGTTATGTGP